VNATADQRSYLRSLDVATLADLLGAQAERDPRLRRELEQRAAARPASGAVADAHRLLDGEDGGYASQVGAVLDTVQRLLDAGSRADLAPLARRSVDKLIATLDAPTGAAAAELDRAVALYARACVAHPPDPERLAEWILGVEFDGPPWPEIDLTAFAEALGDRGLQRIRSTVDAVLAENGSAPPRRRDTASRLREQLAEVSGDVDELVAILSAKPPRLEVSLKIVRVLRSAGRHAEAIKYAARALAHDKAPTAPGETPMRAPVVDALADTYHETGQGDEVLSLRRSEFEREPTYAAYQALREAVEGQPRWALDREAALSLLRERAAGNTEDTRSADDLARVLVAEGRADQAWEAAARYGCSAGLRLELVRGRENEFPDEAIPVYREHIEELIAHKDAEHYREAAKQIRKLRTLHKRSGKQDEFLVYLTNLVKTHQRKTRLIAEVRNARIALPKVTR
jgi:hypothetical protein